MDGQELSQFLMRYLVVSFVLHVCAECFGSVNIL